MLDFRDRVARSPPDLTQLRLRDHSRRAVRRQLGPQVTTHGVKPGARRYRRRVAELVDPRNTLDLRSYRAERHLRTRASDAGRLIDRQGSCQS